jgi:hypothetical protein
MDDKLQKALEFGNYSITLENQKRMLHEKFVTDTIYFHAGGQFTINKELLNYVHMLTETGQETTVLVDDNNIPVEVEVNDFYANIADKFFTASNEYYTAYKKLQKSRSVDGLVE